MPTPVFDSPTIKGTLADVRGISASVLNVGEISGSLNAVTIEATLSDIPMLIGSIGVSETIGADIGVPKTIGGEPYRGDYEVTPSAKVDIILPTKNKAMTDDITVIQIPYYETSNTSGYTVYIASEV